MLVPGKRRRQLVAETSSCPTSGRRLLVTDQVSKQVFLIDTGSDLCCFPRSYFHDRRAASSFELSAANSSIIKTYGYAPFTLNFKGLRRTYPWRFVVADVATPIIGADFLAHYGLLPDCRHNQLIEQNTGLTSSGLPGRANQPSVRFLAPAASSAFSDQDILDEFPELTRPGGTPREVRHSTVHHIKTTPGPPVHCRARRLAPDRLCIAKHEFENMVREGIARRSQSPWSSPLHLVPKKTTGWRPCGDYRFLNARTIPDRYPVKNIQDCSHRIHGSRVFSVVDLVKAYTQIPVNPADVPKTAIITPFGLFEFPFMSFGLRNAGQTFQRFIDEVVSDLDFCFPYLDDILKNNMA